MAVWGRAGQGRIGQAAFHSCWHLEVRWHEASAVGCRDPGQCSPRLRPARLALTFPPSSLLLTDWVFKEVYYILFERKLQRGKRQKNLHPLIYSTVATFLRASQMGAVAQALRLSSTAFPSKRSSRDSNSCPYWIPGLQGVVLPTVPYHRTPHLTLRNSILFSLWLALFPL